MSGRSEKSRAKYNPKQWYRRFVSSRNFLSAGQRIRNALGITAFWSLVRRTTRRFFAFEQPQWSVLAKRAVVPPSNSVTWKQLLNPMYWITWIARFVITWLLSRPYLNLGPAIPAMLVVVLLSGFVVTQKLGKRRDHRQTYETFLARAIDSQDYDTAVVAASTLIDLNPDNLSYRYQRALIESKRGKDEVAQDMMERLAISNRHGLAALWLLSKSRPIAEIKAWEPKDHLRFRKLIEVALGDLAKGELLEARKLMVTYLIAIGAKDDAVRYLKSVCETDASFAFTTALLCRETGRKEDMKQFATQAVRFYESILLTRPEDADARIKYANALLLLDQEQNAISSLRDSVKLTQDQRMLRLISDAYTMWAVRLANEGDPQTVVQRFQLLTQALQITPNHPPAIDAAVELIIECRKNNDKELVSLKDSALKGIDPDSVHFIQGTIALLDNKPDEAKVHFLLITKNKENRTAGILNNLAMSISNSQDGDLKQAKAIADMALQQLPDHPYFCETRGQILFKLKDYRNAMVDLEKAVRAPELRKDAYPTLAKIYRIIGQVDKAEEYETLAKDAADAASASQK